MNVINFTGNLGGDAETRYTNSGKAVTSFNVAMTSGWGDNKTTTWMRCNIWGDRGVKIADYLKKGQMVAVSGEFSAREWENKEGATKTSCEVNVNDVTLCGGKESRGDGEQSTQAASAPQAESYTPKEENFDDDIPF